MGRFRDIFEGCQGRGERALMPYLTAGDPDLATTAALLPALASAGADIMEIGIPFSDPLLDGPVIQSSAHRALLAGTRPHAIMDLVRHLRPRIAAGLLYMVPCNIVDRYGLAAFAADTATAGVDGVLITDLPPEEAEAWQRAADGAGVETIYLLAPTSSPARIRLAAGRATGFIYLISRRGVTGVQQSLPDDLRAVIDRIRAETDTPIAVGFGIATPAHVAQVVALADGAVVGSALVERLAAAGETAAKVAAGTAFVAELKAATRRNGLGGSREG